MGDSITLKEFYKLIRDILSTLDDVENDMIKLDPFILAELKALKNEANIANKDLELFIEERLIRLGVDIRPNLKREITQILK